MLPWRAMPCRRLPRQPTSALAAARLREQPAQMLPWLTAKIALTAPLLQKGKKTSSLVVPVSSCPQLPFFHPGGVTRPSEGAKSAKERATACTSEIGEEANARREYEGGASSAKQIRTSPCRRTLRSSNSDPHWLPAQSSCRPRRFSQICHLCTEGDHSPTCQQCA